MIKIHRILQKDSLNVEMQQVSLKKKELEEHLEKTSKPAKNKSFQKIRMGEPARKNH